MRHLIVQALAINVHGEVMHVGVIRQFFVFLFSNIPSASGRHGFETYQKCFFIARIKKLVIDMDMDLMITSSNVKHFLLHRSLGLGDRNQVVAGRVVHAIIGFRSNERKNHH